MQTRSARLQLQSQRISPTLVAGRDLIFAADNLEALNNRKVVARLWLSGRRVVLPRALPLFHHQKLPKKASRLYLIMAEGNILGRAAADRHAAPRTRNQPAARVDASIGRCSGERTILVVFGRSLIVSLRTQNQR